MVSLNGASGGSACRGSADWEPWPGGSVRASVRPDTISDSFNPNRGSLIFIHQIRKERVQIQTAFLRRPLFFPGKLSRLFFWLIQADFEGDFAFA